MTAWGAGSLFSFSPKVPLGPQELEQLAFLSPSLPRLYSAGFSFFFALDAFPYCFIFPPCTQNLRFGFFLANLMSPPPVIDCSCPTYPYLCRLPMNAFILSGGGLGPQLKCRVLAPFPLFP